MTWWHDVMKMAFFISAFRYVRINIRVCISDYCSVSLGRVEVVWRPAENWQLSILGSEQRSEDRRGPGSRVSPHQSLAASTISPYLRYLGIYYLVIIKTNLYSSKVLMFYNIFKKIYIRISWCGFLIHKSEREGSVQRFNSIFWFGDFLNDIHVGVSRWYSLSPHLISCWQQITVIVVIIQIMGSPDKLFCPRPSIDGKTMFLQNNTLSHYTPWELENNYAHKYLNIIKYLFVNCKWHKKQ